MIISASRRTDLPAFHADWFFDRLAEGFVDVPNPMNRAQIRRVSLLPADVDCIVFWTKNPAPMLPHLHRLEGFSYYFQYTLNGYGADIEPNVPPLRARIESFRRLADALGPARLIWRYDPILLNPHYDAQFHIDRFATIADALKGDTACVVVSFIDYYRKIAKNWRRLEIREPAPDEVERIARAIAAIAAENGMSLAACAEKLPLADYGIAPARCIDPELIESIIKRPLPKARARAQRPLCNCAESADIGFYNSCPHNCAYCYANQSSIRSPQENV
ncbi:MAG: DUF1848 domain-containing protein [Christensenellales bacterium]|jgi:DNA repair photolyase